MVENTTSGLGYNAKQRIPTAGVTGGGYATLTIYTTIFYNDCTSVTFFRPHSFFVKKFFLRFFLFLTYNISYPKVKPDDLYI